MREWVDLYQRFWSRSKNSQSRIIRFKNFRLRLEFLYLIIHSCSFFKQYITTHIQVFCTIQRLSPSTLFYQGGKGVFRDAWWETQIISLMRDRAQISRVRREWWVFYYFHNAWRVIFLWNLRDDWYHSKLVLVMTPTSCPFMSFLDVWFPQIGYYFILFFRDAWWLKKIGLMRVGYPLLFPHVLYAVFFPSVG